MYVSIKDLAVREGCSVSQVYRNVREMERSGLYPNGVMQVGKVRVSKEDFEDFLLRKRRMKWKTTE